MEQEKLREKLIVYLQNAYAMETQVIETLERHAGQAGAYPDIQQRLLEHVEESRQHRIRIEERLAAYSARPSLVKTVLNYLTGNTLAVAGTLRYEYVAQNARDDYTNEHFEISSYLMLIATARAYGDEATARAAELNLHDEFKMEHWMAQHVVELTYRELERDGIIIPEESWMTAKQMAAQSRATQPLTSSTEPITSLTVPIISALDSGGSGPEPISNATQPLTSPPEPGS